MVVCVLLLFLLCQHHELPACLRFVDFSAVSYPVLKTPAALLLSTLYTSSSLFVSQSVSCLGKGDLGGGTSRQALLERYGELLSGKKREALNRCFTAIAKSQEIDHFTLKQLQVRCQIQCGICW